MELDLEELEYRPTNQIDGFGQRLHCRIAYFSLNSRHECLFAHAISGGLVATVHEGEPVLLDGPGRFSLGRVDETPITFAGTAPYMIQNALAAALAAYVRGIEVGQIGQALRTFIPSAETTPGRMNLFDFKHFKFLVDYAHNPAALQSLREFLKRTAAIAKVGIVTGVGDRRNEDIREIGRLAAELFAEVVIRYGEDLRGRTTDEIFSLLREGSQAVRPEVPIQVFQRKAEAITQAIKQAKPGSFIVNCTEKVSETLALIARLCETGCAQAMSDTFRQEDQPVARVTTTSARQSVVSNKDA